MKIEFKNVIQKKCPIFVWDYGQSSSALEVGKHPSRYHSSDIMQCKYYSKAKSHSQMM